MSTEPTTQKFQTIDTGEAIDFPITLIDESAVELQQREDGLDWEHVDDLREALQESDALHPIDIYIDEAGERAWIADGWHRFFAYVESKRKSIPARIHSGGKEAAFKASLGANAKQLARPRRRADLRKAVVAALGRYYYVDLLQCNKLPKEKRLTFEQITELCVVGNKSTVSRIAKDLEAEVKPKTGEQKTDQPTGQAGPQTDFFDQLNESFKPIAEGWKEVVNHTYFLRPEVPKAKKLEAIEGIETELKSYLQHAKDLRSKLEAQEETTAPEPAEAAAV